ncbi:MAG TPA: CoA transferase, partial [Acidimicrobiales bacterium]|nr:CoA transferase [Acidimicrobiales bacterium]
SVPSSRSNASASPGGGWLQADLGAPGDADAFERLLGTLPPGTDARAVEAEAQTWRLPVVAYRRRPPCPAPAARARAEHAPPALAPADPPAPLAGVEVVDLTAVWAGPLATWLLAALGARVTKVESAVRPDGMRGRPAVFAALDAGKEHVALDLRRPDDHAELVERIGASRVLVDSFSPRVMPNLGLTPADLGPAADGLVTASITAFEPGTAEHRWVAYGTGAHAHCGLGDLGTGAFAAPVLSYPDPLAGLAAAAGVLAALAGPGASRVTASLAGAAAPLAAADGAGRLVAAPGEAVAGLRARLAERGWLDDRGFPRPPFVLGGAS